MKRLVFLVEERSIAEVLTILLPRLLPSEIAHQVVPHEGKSDLEKSIPRKLRAWKEPGVSFIVVRDNDGKDCKALKSRLTQMCAENGRPDTLVRLVCQELEAWYLGDLAAVSKAYGKPELAKKQKLASYRDPDSLSSPSRGILKLVPEHSKIAGAKAIAPYMSLEVNRSKSFHVFLAGVRRVAEIGSSPQTELPFFELS